MAGGAPSQPGGGPGRAGALESGKAAQFIGVCECLAAAASYAGAALFVKLASEGFGVLQILWVRGLLQLLFIATALLVRCQPPWGPREIRCWLLLRGVLGVLAVSCYFLGIVGLSVAGSVAIFSVKPILAALLGAIFLAEPLKPAHVLAAALSLSGCLVVAQGKAGPAASVAGLPRPAVAGLVVLGALLAAAVDVVLRVIMTRSQVPAECSVWYFCLTDVALLAAATPLLRRSPTLSTGPSGGPGWHHALAMLGASALSMLGQQLMTLAYRRLPVAFGALLLQTETVHAFALQVAVYRKVALRSLVGAALIATGTALLAVFEMRTEAREWTKLKGDGNFEPAEPATVIEPSAIGRQLGDGSPLGGAAATSPRLPAAEGGGAAAE